MVGDIVNLSARLMKAAQSSVLCDATTYHKAKSAFNFDLLPPIKVKGKLEPVAVFGPTVPKKTGTSVLWDKVKSSVKSTSAIIGRDAELAIIERILNEKQGIIMIEGDSGMGITYLLYS